MYLLMKIEFARHSLISGQPSLRRLNKGIGRCDKFSRGSSYGFSERTFFISYSRADGGDYALRLASELAAGGFSCIIDQWGTEPGSRIPGAFLRELRRCRAMVVLGSRGSGQSNSVEQEISEFRSTRGIIVAVDLDQSIRSARWWPLIEGLPIALENSGGAAEPSAMTLERIKNALTFRRRDERLRRSAWVAGGLVFTLLVASAAIGLALRSQSKALVLARQDTEEQRDAAEQARRNAEGAQETAVRARAEADVAQHEAKAAQDFTSVTRATGFARANLDPLPAASLAAATEASRLAQEKGVAPGESLEMLLTTLGEVGGQGNQAHQNEIGATAFTPDGKLLVSVSKDGWMKAWHIGPQGWMGPAWHVRVDIDYPDYVAVSQDGNWLALRGIRQGSLWRLSSEGPTKSLSWSASEQESGRQPYIALNASGSRMLVVSANRVEAINFDSSGLARKVIYAAPAIGNAAISDNGRFAAVVVGSTRALIWDLETSNRPPTQVELVLPEMNQRAFWDGPTDIAISNDGRKFAAGADYTFGISSLDATIKVWTLDPARSHTPITLEGSRGHILA